VLHYPKIKKRYSLSEETLERVITNLYCYTVIIRNAPRMEAVPDDPDDNKFISAAITGKADYIVTGDGHLLDLGSYQGIEIVTPKVFLELSQNP